MDKNINILVVDDYKTMRRVIHSLLNQLGFQNIDEAINGSDALEKMKEKKYQLIVSDWNMSPVTGNSKEPAVCLLIIQNTKTKMSSDTLTFPIFQLTLSHFQYFS